MISNVNLIVAFLGAMLSVSFTSRTSPGDLSPIAALGQKIFNDTSLSPPGNLSYAGCHVKERAYASDDSRVVPLGGADFTNLNDAIHVTPGFRNAPSLKYLSEVPAFFFADDGTPTAGFDRDGRVNTLAEQARRLFFCSSRNGECHRSRCHPKAV